MNLWKTLRAAPGRLWKRATRPFRAVRDFFQNMPEDTPLADTLGDSFEAATSFSNLLQALGEHLEALRRHLLRSLLALLITTTFSFIFTDKLVAVLSLPLGLTAADQTFNPGDLWQLAQQTLATGEKGLEKLQVIEPTEAVGVFMRVALLAGCALAMPWIILEAYLFIAPGLMPRSRLLLLGGIPCASLLFVAGLAFTYLVMLPTAIPFLYNFMGFRAAWRPAAYFGLVTTLMFWVGVIFQMPLAAYGLAAAGLVRARFLAAQWRLALILIAVLAALITPTTDPVTMILVMAPMLLLYGLSLLAAQIAEWGRRPPRPVKR